jgi:hypothetical protein
VPPGVPLVVLLILGLVLSLTPPFRTRSVTKANGDWAARCRQFDDAVVNRAKPILTTEQVELLKESFSHSAEIARPRQGKN